MNRSGMKLGGVCREKLDEVLKRAEKAKLDAVYMAEDFGPGWLGINEEEPIESWSVSYGFADQVLALIVYDDFVEVGIGECIRPYGQLYQGKDVEVAVDTFVAEAEKMIENK